MGRLGYTRYVAQGGDVGAGVTDAMARQAPTGLLGIHLNFLRNPSLELVSALFGGAPAPAGMSEKEQAAFNAFAPVIKRGYIVEQVEHPQTGGLTRERIVDNLTLYWLTASATSAAQLSGSMSEASLLGSGLGSHRLRFHSRWPTRCSPTSSSRPRAAGPRRSIPTSPTSTRSTGAATSPPGKSHSCSPKSCGAAFRSLRQ
jgi:hypothetical protein